VAWLLLVLRRAMAGGFASMGLAPELLRACDETGWLLPTDVRFTAQRFPHARTAQSVSASFPLSYSHGTTLPKLYMYVSTHVFNPSTLLSTDVFFALLTSRPVHRSRTRQSRSSSAAVM
jgi:hypothetical protein